LLKALIDAARRGIDVKLVLPSYSDSGAIFHLGRSYYTDLLRSGVQIYQLRGAVMHAKTACIDGICAARRVLAVINASAALGCASY
jgi:cardiolipin synthase